MFVRAFILYGQLESVCLYVYVCELAQLQCLLENKFEFGTLGVRTFVGSEDILAARHLLEDLQRDV